MPVGQGSQSLARSWNLIPGEPWQEAIEKSLQSRATCAVFIGPSGTGPWQNEEMHVGLDSRDDGVQPSGHPSAFSGADRADPNTLPDFRGHMTRVSFRNGLDDAIAFNPLLAEVSRPRAEARSSAKELGPTLRPIPPHITGRPVAGPANNTCASRASWSASQDPVCQLGGLVMATPANRYDVFLSYHEPTAPLSRNWHTNWSRRASSPGSTGWNLIPGDPDPSNC